MQYFSLLLSVWVVTSSPWHSLTLHMQFFLDPLKSAARQYPDSRALQWVLHFGVKYYVPDPHLLKDDLTK